MLLLILTHFHLDVPPGRRTSGCSINIFCMECSLTTRTIWSSQNDNRSERKICRLPSFPEFQPILLPFTRNGILLLQSFTPHVIPEHLFYAYNYAEHWEHIKEQDTVPCIWTGHHSLVGETYKKRQTKYYMGIPWNKAQGSMGSYTMIS